MSLFNFEDGSMQKEEIKPIKSNLSETEHPGLFLPPDEELEENYEELEKENLDQAHREADAIMRELKRKKIENKDEKKSVKTEEELAKARQKDLEEDWEDVKRTYQRF